MMTLEKQSGNFDKKFLC